jgi:hypothetical protein
MLQLSKVDSKNLETLLTLTDQFEFNITKKLRDNIDWDMVFSVIQSYKSTYNENMLRFVKSHLISKAIQKYSGGYMEYVNQTGYDFITKDNFKIELKTGLKIFQKRKQQTSDIIISNTQGQSTDTKVFEKTFDYLLMVEPGMAGVTSWEKMRPYIKPRGDCFKAQIPMTEIEIFKVEHSVEDFNFDLSDRIEEALDKALLDIEKKFKRIRSK